MWVQILSLTLKNKQTNITMQADDVNDKLNHGGSPIPEEAYAAK